MLQPSSGSLRLSPLRFVCWRVFWPGRIPKRERGTENRKTLDSEYTCACNPESVEMVAQPDSPPVDSAQGQSKDSGSFLIKIFATFHKS